MAQHKSPHRGKIRQFTVHASLTPEIGQALNKMAKSEDRSVSSMVRVLIQEAMKAREVER